MSHTQPHTDQELFQLLQENKEEAVTELFRRHYVYVCKSAYRIIGNEAIAEDLAQDVFLGLWKRRAQLNIKTSVKAYLKKAVTNKALNYIRDQKMKFTDTEKMPEMPAKAVGIHQELEKEELEQVIQKAVNRLPERCRIVFCLSRFEELSYQEIADQLEISIKTVENQISKALKFLRAELIAYRNN
ncbi:MAG: RNA polymerase sigma-70 factor [Bacteroidota bacterium]